MAKASELALAMDIGGTNYRVGLVDRRGKLFYWESHPTLPERGFEATAAEITGVLRDMIRRAGNAQIVGLGVGAAGPVNSKSGRIYNPPHLPGWSGISLTELWGKELKLPTWVGNDANLEALGEYRFGAGKGVRDFVYISVGTGIGGGIITDGRLLEGARGYAGEVGHMTIDPEGPRCDCGNIGCLEALVSGTAIARKARERLAQQREGYLWQLAEGNLTRVTALEVEQAAQSGDPLATEVMREAAVALAKGMVNLIHLFNPSVIAVGGGVTKNWQRWESIVKEHVYSHTIPAFREGTSIVQAVLGDSSGLLGAGSLVFSRVG